MVHIRLLEDANDQSMLMKGSRKPSDNLGSSSHRTFEEQVRQIFTTEEVKIPLIMPCAAIDILPAPHTWVKESPFPSLFLRSEKYFYVWEGSL